MENGINLFYFIPREILFHPLKYTCEVGSQRGSFAFRKEIIIVVGNFLLEFNDVTCHFGGFVSSRNGGGGGGSCLFNQDSQSRLIPYRSDCLGVDSFTSGWPVHSESWQSPPKHIGSFSLRVGHGTLSGIMAPDKKNCLD